MTAVATRVPCPADGCTYATDAASMPAHVAMAHPEAPAAAVVPKRSARNGHTVSAPAAIPPAAGAPELRQLPLELVRIGPNVRVDIAELEELAASIREHGVLQPIKVTGPHPDGTYLVTWGQRRTLASQLAEQPTIPAIVTPADPDLDAKGATRSIEQLVENLHRADLNPIDRAEAMRAVVDSGVSQADLARKLGIAPSTVANDLRLLALDAGVLDSIRTGALSPAHGKAIASLPAKQQRELAEAVVNEKLSAHALEGRIKWKTDEAAAEKAKAERTVKWIPKCVKALEEAGVPKNAEISVGSASYKVDEHALRAAIKQAGWTKQGYGYRQGRVEGCDCAAVRIDLGGLKPAIEAVCSNPAHQPTNEDLSAKWAAERKARADQLARFRAAVRYELSVARPRERMGRVLLDVLSSQGWYRSPDQEAKHRAELDALSYDEVLDRLANHIAQEQHARNVHDVDAFTAEVVAAGWQGHAPNDPAPELRKKADGRARA